MYIPNFYELILALFFIHILILILALKGLFDYFSFLNKNQKRTSSKYPFLQKRTLINPYNTTRKRFFYRFLTTPSYEKSFEMNSYDVKEYTIFKIIKDPKKG